MTVHRPFKKRNRALGMRFKITDVLDPKAALAREAMKATGRMLQSERDGDNRNRRNAVRVSPRTREQFGKAPTDVLLKKLRVLIATAPELEEDDQSSGLFDIVTDWMDDAGVGDPEDAAQTFKALARQGRRSELNQIFEHTVRTMAAAEESIQTRHPNTRSRLDTAYARLQQFGRDCVTLQAQTAGEVITILSERVGGAMAKLGEGGGAGLRVLLGSTITQEINFGGNMIWQEDRTAYDFFSPFATNLYNPAQVAPQPTAFAGGDLDDPYPIAKRRLMSAFASDGFSRSS